MIVLAKRAFKTLIFFLTSFETSSSEPTLVAQGGLIDEAIGVFEMDAIGSSETVRKPEVTRMYF